MDLQALNHRRKSYQGVPPWFAAAAHAMRSVDVPLPLVTGDGRLLGMARGARAGSRFDFAPAQASPYNSYDNLVATLTAATPQRFSYIYEKDANNNMSQNSWNDLWCLTGSPAAGAYAGAARTAVQFDDTTLGALTHGGNVTPQSKYLLSFMPWTTVTALRAWMLYDRVLTYEACTMTAGSQAMINTLSAQRYVATGQPGLRALCTSQTAHNATAADLTVMNYTDNAGAPAAIPTTPANVLMVNAGVANTTNPAKVCCPGTATGSQVLRSPFLPLAVGTTGMRSITDYTWSAAPTGTNCFVLMYPLALVTDGNNLNIYQILDTVNSIGGAVRVYDGACPSMLLYNSANSGRVTAIGDFGWTS